MQRHANRQPLWHLTVKGWLYQQQILKIGERLKMHNTPVNRQYQKSKETCPYCLGRRHQFCTLCKEAGVRLKRWAGGKMNDNLAPTKPGMNVTGGWGQEVHRVKTQKSACVGEPYPLRIYYIGDFSLVMDGKKTETVFLQWQNIYVARKPDLEICEKLYVTQEGACADKHH